MCGRTLQLAKLMQLMFNGTFGGVPNPVGRFARKGYTLIALGISLPQVESHTCYHM